MWELWVLDELAYTNRTQTEEPAGWYEVRLSENLHTAWHGSISDGWRLSESLAYKRIVCQLMES